MDISLQERLEIGFKVFFILVFSLNSIEANRTQASRDAIQKQSTGWEQRVRDDVMRGYRKDIPSLNARPVTVTYALTKIIDVDEKLEQISLAAYIVIIWTDMRLQWDWEPSNETDFASPHLHFTLGQIWYPNVEHYNNVGRAVLMNKEQRVHAAGYTQVSWYGNQVLTSPCEMDVTYFPMDIQTCDLQFRIQPRAPFADLDGIVLSDDDMFSFLSIQSYPDSAWRINRTNGIQLLPKESTTSMIVTFRHTLGRKYQYYVYRIFAPITILSRLVLCAFFIPPDAGEKISLGVTLLLTFSFFQMMVEADLPATSDSTPLITRAMILLQACSAMSIVASVLVLHLHHNTSQRGNKIPKWIRIVFFKILAKVICQSATVEDSQVSPTSQKSAETNEQPDVEKANNYQNKTLMQTDSAQSSEDMKRQNEQLKSLVANLREKADNNVAEGEEWKLLAMILDRVLMYVCLITMSLIYITLFSQLLSGK